MKIKNINTEKKVLIVAEIGNNHEGSFELAKELIKIAHTSGADAVKFQLFKASALYPKDKKMFKIFKSIELSHKMFRRFYKFSKKMKIDISASVFDIKSGTN